MPRWLLCIALLLGLAPALAAEKLIRVAVPAGGFPPFIVVAENAPLGGLMIDVLRTVATSKGYRIEGVEAVRKRTEQMVLDGSLDAVPRAREWTPHHRRFLFTDPVMRVRDVVISRKDAPVHYETPNSLLGKRVGTHLGYAYPQLESYFNLGHIQREDAPNEDSMLRKLHAGRSDVAIVNELTALWLIKNEHWNGQFTWPAKELDGYEYRFMFHKRWKPFVAHFNRELARLRQDGRLAALLARYRSSAE